MYQGYSTLQFITVSEQRLDEEQHQQAAGEVFKPNIKFGRLFETSVVRVSTMK